MAAMVICYGFLVFCGNIRIDTEELMNNPGSNLGWLVIGRWSLVLFKKLLGLTVHNTVASGVLFFLFFWLGANLLTFALYHLTERKERWHYWIFLLLYVTSNIWCYQIYFSLQQAEVAFAMLLLVIAAILAMKACFASVLSKADDWQSGGHEEKSVWRNGFKIVLSAVLLFLGLGAYQALAAYYIAICLVLFLVMLPETDGGEKLSADDIMTMTANDSKTMTANGSGEMQTNVNRDIRRGVLLLIIHFAVVYIAYTAYVKYFMVSSDYMESQMGWGRLAKWLMQEEYSSDGEECADRIRSAKFFFLRVRRTAYDRGVCRSAEKRALPGTALACTGNHRNSGRTVPHDDLYGRDACDKIPVRASCGGGISWNVRRGCA